MKRHTNPYSLPPNSTVFNTIHHIPTWGRFPAYPVNPAAPIIPSRLITHNSLALNKILTENRSLWAVLPTRSRINIRHNSSLSSPIHAHRRLLQQLQERLRRPIKFLPLPAHNADRPYQPRRVQRNRHQPTLFRLASNRQVPVEAEL